MFLEELSGFEGRTHALHTIRRFAIPQRTPMFYRTNDLLHSQRVHVLVKDISSVLVEKIGTRIDINKALTLALVHDDAEIITGDVPVYHKMRMTPGQLADVHAQEERAIEQLALRWPFTIGGYTYRELLRHALNKDCIEGQIVSYCDKLDAFGESLHEVFAGNRLFIDVVYNYISILKTFPTTYPLLGQLIPHEHPLFGTLIDIDVGAIAARGQPHTASSIKQKTGIGHYNRWRELTIAFFGIEPLIQVQES